ncbi:MAG TPA: aminotransferase class I/II-fold pyridoxal phosphate-dependent enzyme, partial [Candidatus Angelobacter sp.]|nr:aminotransferase class I/II-fold pyridoxal phosphate-dependent enzyme [Candidatus Angelobacter sp.]
RNHILVADEAHSIGVLGDHGRGLLDALGVRGGHIIRTATLSKALGCMGGLILGSMSLLDRIRSTASAYSATSALAPALCRAAIAALSVLADDEQRLRRLRENCNLMSAQLTSVPLAKRGPTAPIFCLESGPNRDPGRIHLRCKEKDIFVPLITDYPGTDSKGLLRWIVQADHEADEIESLCSILRSELGVR